MISRLCFLIFLSVVFSAIGCKPKEATIAGQVFVVTRGGESIKLGAVEIFLLEKVRVADFLKDKQPVVESVIAARQQAVTDAKEEAKRAQVAFDYYLLNGISMTNADYLRLNAQIEDVNQQRKVLLRQFDTIETQRESAAARGRHAQADALLVQEDLIIEKQQVKAAEATRLFEEFMQFRRLQQNQETNKLLTAQSRAVFAEEKLNSSPAAEDYFAQFSPIPLRTTISDADGKFQLPCPRDRAFTIFAKARREVMNTTEVYYWLIDAPVESENPQLFLSNNNQVFADPNGYFKLKPKQSSR